MFADYYECRKWLENFIPYTYSKENLGLERIRNLLKLLGNPQDKFKSIHVGGTSGKGSTAYYIAQLLQMNAIRHSPFAISSERRKIGLHLSPHLVDIRERMQIFQRQKAKGKRQKFRENLMPIARFAGLVNAIKPVVDEIISRQPHLTPSYFEILVAMSFKYFADEKVDFAVVEVGLGGRLDATNVLQPAITVITNVGLDHTEILGNTIEEIAYEKAGIVKGAKVKSQKSKGAKLKARPFSSRTSDLRPGLGSGVPVVTGATGKALEVIEKVAKEKNAPLITVNTQLGVEPLNSDILKSVPIYKEMLRDSRLQLAFSNKLLAITAVSQIMSLRAKRSNLKKGLPRPSILSGLAMIPEGRLVMTENGLPGRLKEIERGVILDGAHNIDKIKFLINFVKNSKLETLNSKQIQKQKTNKSRSHVNENLDPRFREDDELDVILVVAFKKGKDWRKMVDLLIQNLSIKKVIVTKFYAVTDTGRFSAVEPEEIEDFLNKKQETRNKKLLVKSFDNSQEAVFEALRLRSKSTTVLVTGSLYLVGEAMTMWELPDF